MIATLDWGRAGQRPGFPAFRRVRSADHLLLFSPPAWTRVE